MVLERKLILGSNSPRRKEILNMAGFEFEVIVRPINESFSAEMQIEKVPEYLAKKKAEAFADLAEKSLILTADTVVILNGQILNKPTDQNDARLMLHLLSGKTHRVITAICIYYDNNLICHSEETEVTFKMLSTEEIDFYIYNHSPLDKAGAYGVQDFIGMIGVTDLKGSFYNVMGLPIHAVYQLFKPFIRF
jgi:septum formation protein